MSSFFENKPVLVTGGAGFIGSHLCRELIRQGALVTVLDNLSTGSRDNLAEIQEEIEFIEGSITHYDTCLRATAHKEAVFHLAAFISVPQSLKTPLLCYENNVTGTANLLEACRQNKVERFIFSSSSAVYGNREGLCRENDPCAPTSPYGLSKLIGEQYCQSYGAIFGLKTACLRYFNVYGDRQSPHGDYAAVRAKFSHNLRHNLPITIYGDGTQTRDFIPVERVVEANLRLSRLQDPLMRGEPYNIATGASISLLELISELKQAYPTSSSPILFENFRPGDIAHSSASCARYHEAIKTYQ